MFGFNLFTWSINLIPAWFPTVIIITSIITYIVSSIAGILPGLSLLYKELIRVVSIALFAFGFYLVGCVQYANQVKVEIKKEIEYVDRVKVEQKVVTKYVVKYLKEKQQNIGENYGKLEQGITTKDDSMCVVPKSFVRLHDMAAEGSVPGSTTGTDGTTSKVGDTTSTGIPSGVKLSEAEKVILHNYEKYYNTAAQLESLQQWVNDQRKLNK